MTQVLDFGISEKIITLAKEASAFCYEAILFVVLLHQVSAKHTCLSIYLAVHDFSLPLRVFFMKATATTFTIF